MSSKILTTLLMISFIIACTPTQQPITSSQSMPNLNIPTIPIPPDFTTASTEAQASEQYLAVHGTVASVFLTEKVLETTGHQELARQLGGKLLSFNQLSNACGSPFICYNRHKIDPSAINSDITLKQANGLWVSLAGLNGEPEPGIAFSSSAAYAAKGVQTRFWLPSVASQKIQEAQQILISGGLDAEEIAQLETYIQFEQQRLQLYYDLQQNNPQLFKLWEEARGVPVVLKFKVSPNEVTRTNFAYQSGPGTRITSGVIDFSRIETVYADTMSAELKAFLESQGLKVELTENIIQQNSNLWSQMPQTMYNLAFQGTTAFEQVVYYWGPIIGVVALVATPYGVAAEDIATTTAEYYSVDTNLTWTEWYQLRGSWAQKMRNVADDGLGNPLYPIPDPKEPLWGYRVTKPLHVGETTEITFSIKREYDIEHHVAGGLIVDTLAIDNLDINTIKVTIVNLSPPTITLTIDDEDKKLILGQSNNDFIWFGCVEYGEDKEMSIFYDIRYIAQNDTLQLLTRPQLFVGKECITNIKLP